jgi:predicted pyridoxine 5'-phosphate oxidase superfamily flavin-nucleotide-binding protein
MLISYTVCEIEKDTENSAGSNSKEDAMINENVKNILESSMWDLATCSNGDPNVVPVAFKTVTDDGKLAVGDVFLETTLNNIKANNGKIAISVYDAQSLEGYQIKGTAEYVTEGAIVDTFKKMVEDMFNGAATAKGALLITPEKVIVTTPGADNKKVL